MKKVLIMTTFLILVLNTSVFAMTPTFTNDAKFSRGVGNCCYYIDDSASSYSQSIWDGAYNWENTGFGANPIYMTHVSSNYATHMDFYSRTTDQDTILYDSLLGYTSFFYTDGTLVVPKRDVPKNDYFYSEIVFNGSNGKSWDYKTAKHEMGHAFGLSHTDNEYSIMYPNIYGMQVSSVQKCDHDTINYLYN